MTEIDKFEFLVLGSGEAGKYLAWTMAKATANRSGGTPMDRWFLSEYCLFTKQKRHLERKSCQSIRERP